MDVQSPSVQPGRKGAHRGSLGICTFTTEPPENLKNQEKSFKEEFLDFQTELFIDLNEKFRDMEENLKQHTENLLNRREEEIFTKMDHESFKEFLGLKFDCIKKSVDAFIKGAHKPPEHYFIDDKTFKEEKEDLDEESLKQSMLDCYIDEMFNKDMSRCSLSPSTSSPMTSTTPSPRGEQTHVLWETLSA